MSEPTRDEEWISTWFVLQRDLWESWMSPFRNVEQPTVTAEASNRTPDFAETYLEKSLQAQREYMRLAIELLTSGTGAWVAYRLPLQQVSDAWFELQEKAFDDCFAALERFATQPQKTIPFDDLVETWRAAVKPVLDMQTRFLAIASPEETPSAPKKKRPRNT